MAGALELWCVAQTIWGEARGEPKTGRIAVAWVILNRQRVHRRWQGKTLTAICKAKWQFSCWNPDDPNAPLLPTLDVNRATFAACLHISIDVIGGRVASPVGEATHYYAQSLTTPPRWAVGKKPIVVIGHHRFYQNIA